MEDNIAKLLQIVGGVLVGVILLSLVSYFFSSIGLWPMEQDQIETAEQLKKFNLEYEVYDKKGMYGVDVISCLNKANSNNKKYADGGGFLTGNEYGKDFYIDVYVRLTKKPLQESIEYYYFQNGSQVQGFEVVDSSTGDKGIGKTMQEVGFDIEDGKFYTKFKKTDYVGNAEETLDEVILGIQPILPNGGDYKCETPFNSTSEIDGYYSLRYDENIVKLIELSNKSDNGNLNKIVTNTTGRDLNIWSRVIWKTALSDFKSRRFKCDYLGYSKKTGRVCELYFSEI